MNELANFADKVGAYIEMVRQNIGSDPRIGYGFLYAGPGYGGLCLRKDVRSLNRTAQEKDQSLRMLAAVEAVNNSQKRVLEDKVVERFGPDLAGRRFAIWGLAFKPNTADAREAPSRVTVPELLRRGASLHVHDPIALNEARRSFEFDFADEPGLRSRIGFADTHMDALCLA